MEMLKINEEVIEITKEIIIPNKIIKKTYSLEQLNDEISIIQSKLIELQAIKAELLKK